jgi:hypothetical protein
VGDAGFEVVHEAADGVGQFAAVVGDDAIGELTGDLSARRLVGGDDPGLELGPPILRHFGGEAPSLSQASL